MLTELAHHYYVINIYKYSTLTLSCTIEEKQRHIVWQVCTYMRNIFSLDQLDSYIWPTSTYVFITLFIKCIYRLTILCKMYYVRDSISHIATVTKFTKMSDHD